MFEKEYTLIMIKPDAVEDGHTGAIIKRIEDEGFRIRGIKMIRLTKAQAKEFYKVHNERPFFNELTEFIASGTLVAACLERENAIEHWRNVIGATDPSEAGEGTIRKLFARSKGENAVHGSDSVENAEIETDFFFSRMELVKE
ncbi:MAG: nucleoside-diphosphate kinase [Spirochaetia bacterium]|nr:nucleoside-diphosphate kinase [Spirochaetia bacterium]